MCYQSEPHAHFRGRPMPDFGASISSMVRGMMSHMQNCWSSFEGWVPHYTEEYKGYYKIIVPMPGFAKEDIEVSLISHNLNIKAKKDVIKDDEKVKHKKGEPFDRNQFISQFFTNLWDHGINLDIKLPSNVNTDEITSKMAEGLLQIKVGKKEPKTIDINENSNDYK